jgi:DNA-binding TFAR19-related protein (PDSD5 family)
LQQPGITDAAREQVQTLIGDLREAQDAGDVEAILKLTGAAETEAGIDEATADRDTEVRVESRNGPAVKRYLDGLADERLAKIRVESRNGPAVKEYLDGLARERLAIIRVETRGGPAVDRYLDELARERGATIAPRAPGMAGAPSVGSALGTMTAAPSVRLASVELDLRLTGSLDRSQAARAERGRATVEDIRAYEARSGKGWRGGGRT